MFPLLFNREGTWRRVWGWFHATVRQSDTWFMVAWLALAGWTIDALRLFLEMHNTLMAGLEAFVSHFWYVVPMTGAVLVLRRLHPQPSLCGVAIYDDSGVRVHGWGECEVGRLATSGMLAVLREAGPEGLHGLALPSGGTVYFVRDVGRTMLLHFSSTVSPETVTAEVARQRLARPRPLDLVAGLEPDVAALAATVITSPVKRDLLTALQRWQTLEMRDLAYWAHASEPETARALDDLVSLGLINSQPVCDTHLYRLNREPEAENLLEALSAWQAHWQHQRVRLERVVGS